MFVLVHCILLFRPEDEQTNIREYKTWKKKLPLILQNKLLPYFSTGGVELKNTNDRQVSGDFIMKLRVDKRLAITYNISP